MWRNLHSSRYSFKAVHAAPIKIWNMPERLRIGDPMKNPLKLILLLVTSLCFASFGADIAPEGVTLFSAEGYSHLKIDCTGNKNLSVMTCTFIEVFISKKEEKDLKEESERTLSSIKSETKKTGLGKAKKEICDSAGKLNSSLAEWKKDGIAENRIKPVAEMKKGIEDLCACQNESCFMDKFGKVLTGADTCTVWINTFTETFKRDAIDSWVSQDDSPVCVTTIGRLQRNSKYPSFWSYSNQRVSKESKNELCKNVDTKRYAKYAWNYPSSAELNCKYIAPSKF